MCDDIDPLDLAVLDPLYDVLGKDKLQELLVGYTQRLDELVAIFQDPTIENMFERAHELKGMSANYGFSEISAWAKTLEDIADNHDTAQAHIKKLPDICQRAQKSISQWMSEKG